MSKIEVIFTIVVVVLGISFFSYEVQRCGLGRTLLFGKSAFWMAVIGMCDEPVVQQ